MSKKVFLIRNVAPEKFGGGETYQLELARELKTHGFSPAIITNSKELLRRAKEAGFKTFVPPYISNQNWSGAKNLLLPFFWLKLKTQERWYSKLFQVEQPSVVNIQSRDDWLSATCAAKKLKIKIFWTDHIDFRSWALWNIDEKFKNPIGKQIIKIASRVDKIIFISDYEYNWFTSLPTNQKFKNLTIIKNGAIDQFEKYKDIKPVKNSFCYVGRIVDYKGISELITAFERISSKHLGATLNIFGDGDVKKYQTATSCPNITFHGYTKNPLEAIAKNEFFVLPSHREGLSLSLLDAAMMQKTIIVTDVGAATEVIDHKKSGLLVHPGSTEALANAMLEVLENKSLSNSMAKNARKKFEQEFNFDQIFEQQMLPLYRTKD